MFFSSRHRATALPVSLVDIWWDCCLLNAARVCVANKNNLDCGSVFFLFFFFLLPIHSNPPPPKKKQKTQFWVSSLQFSGLRLYHFVMILFASVPSAPLPSLELWRLNGSSGFPWSFDSNTHLRVTTQLEKKEKKKNRDCSASGFHRFPREITEPQQVMSSDSGSYCLRLGSVPSRPLEVTCWVCESCFSLWLVSGCIVGGVIIVFCSRCYWNKALERFLVFTVAQRRPGRGRSSGAGEARCGRPWDSRASAPVRSPRRCLWWTDGPCSSWLL